MEKSTVEKVFSLLNDLAELLVNDLQLDPVDALIEAADFWITGEADEAHLSESAFYQMTKRVEELPLQSLSAAEAYQGWQYALLKLLHQYAQGNHQMTPDVVVVLINHFADLLLKDKKDIRVYDPASGSGHLLFQFIQHLAGRVSVAVANDIDEAMTDFVAIGAHLNRLEIVLENLDASTAHPNGQFDVILSDLPIEHDKEIAIMAQSVVSLADDGILLLVVPVSLIEGEEAGKMIELLRSSLVLNAFIKLPTNLFAKNAQQKGILVLRKKGPGVTQPRQVLLASMPPVSDKEATKEMMTKIDEWFETEMRGL